MNTEKDDIGLEELFRNKLESAEIVPSSGFNSTLMKKLARREFMSFNPAKFNVFYAGGAFIAGIATVLVLSLNNNEPSVNNQPDIASEIIISKSRGIVAEKNPVITNEAEDIRQPVKQPVREVKASVSIKETLPVAEKSSDIVREEQSSISIGYTNINPALMKNDIVGKGQLVDNRLVINTRLFTPSVAQGCAPLQVRFVAAEGIDSCRWSFGNNVVSSGKTPTWEFVLPGEYNVSLEAFSKGKSVGVYSEVITVYTKPTARFEINPEKAILPDDEVRFVNYSSGAVRYQWSFGDGSGSHQFEPLYRYKTYGDYTVTLKAYNEYGCVDSAIMQNAFASSKCYIEFPNAIIQNPTGPSGGLYSQRSDELAHIFHPAFFGVAEYNLSVYSRNGMLLFETSDINIGWDGYFKGQLCSPGVYVWKATGKYRNGEPFTKRGDVTLLKN